MEKDQRIKIAVQKSGRLTENSLELLHRCGLVYSRGRDELICYGENMPIDILLVRDDDIPDLVRDDICDVGIVGYNVMHERRLELEASEMPVSFELHRTLDYGHCKLCLAVPESEDYAGPQTLQGKRIATSYPNLLREYLGKERVSAEIAVMSGAIEIAPKLGKADLICDLVSSGRTLAANHLRPVATVLQSQAALITTGARLPAAKRSWLERLLRRMEGVLQVRESKYIMLHAPRASLAEIRRLLPGSETPTVIPLEGCDDRVAVHAVCRENVFWETLEDLKGAGASSVLVLPVEKMLA
ncbi:MAG: ATP phosphoribosyltransferase [Chromatiales bacterium]|nr:MAG: ATP phosphoribosyltransferase [Chromatiales bacterium]